METRSERLGQELGRLARCHPRSIKVMLILALCVGLAAWASYPPKILAIDNACMPDSFWKAVSADIYGDVFWWRQIGASAAYREKLEQENLELSKLHSKSLERPSEIVSTSDPIENWNNFLEEQYRLYPQLAPTPVQRYASQLRAQADKYTQRLNAQADAIEFADLIERQAISRAQTISWLTICETKMGRRFGTVPSKF